MILNITNEIKQSVIRASKGEQFYRRINQPWEAWFTQNDHFLIIL